MGLLAHALALSFVSQGTAGCGAVTPKYGVSSGLMLGTCGVPFPCGISQQHKPSTSKAKRPALGCKAARPVTDPIGSTKRRLEALSLRQSRSELRGDGTSTVECRGHAPREVKSISSTHHWHHHRLLCHPPVGHHSPFGPGRGDSVMWFQTCSFDPAASPPHSPPGLFSHKGSPVTPDSTSTAPLSLSCTISSICS